MTGTELLRGKTAIVTGASSGIGRGIACTLAEHGANIVVADIRDEPREGGEPTHELIPADIGPEATYIECDVSNREDFESAADAAEALGGVDILVNNAGIFHWGEFQNTTETDFDQMIDVNTKSAYFGSQIVAERMAESGGGSIINITSIASIIGDGDQSLYGISKGATKLLTYSLADALAKDGIRVNAIAPGAVETMIGDEEDRAEADDQLGEFVDNVPLGRAADPSELGGAAVFLASELASYVTAETLVVDGGYTFTH